MPPPELAIPFLVRIRVWGERACFTRPEMKVERVSYDVITPSAARGILEAIYWKPQIGDFSPISTKPMTGSKPFCS
jgi:CRISPR-associated Cas5-like protein